MASHWKSTPSYWCKFCSIYVRDTGIERKNHEASARHQNSIQKNLRKLHKDKVREDREKEAAKREIDRLNGLVGGTGAVRVSSSSAVAQPPPRMPPRAAPVPRISMAEHRKAQAEQLMAMGLEVPKELLGDVTGVGQWRVVSQTFVEQKPSVPLAESNVQDREQDETQGGVAAFLKRMKNESERDDFTPSSGKRRRDEDENALEEEDNDIRGSRTWTSQEDEDLEELLSGVTTKKIKTEDGEVKEEDPELPVKTEEGGVVIKREDDDTEQGFPVADRQNVKVETSPPAPPILFKKRKQRR
ncbi:hypothetical protein K470DRAFT_258510 [Piedraia hortae CBS 480.64]|uniref:Matrin-type domain-containing protein n=1 Tax=Piedraia hortae CBS 480.64 TaxID=1314780 RepID=A0A6A7BXM4_9PEZI|nr:hypothetical protein K470DRAFT_258510 [Piedraia hortae CBS 480.64]